MNELFVLTIILFFSLPSTQCQAPTPASIAGTQEFPCINMTEQIISPRFMEFWKLNQSYHVIRLIIIPQDCEYLYVVTDILIRIQGRDNDVDIGDYNISYRLNENIKTVPLSQLEVSTSLANRRTIINIDPILIEEMWISKNIVRDGDFEVIYLLRGHSTPRLRVLSYEIEEPNPIRTDDTYSGVCNGRVCYGGRGQLMDGFIGSESDTFRSDSNVMWRCGSQEECIFPLRIQLNGFGLVSYIKLYGFNSSISSVDIPDVELIQPNIPTNVTINASSLDTYSIKIPINTVTDEIDLNITIKGMSDLVLSEVEVFSDGVNIALFSLKTCQCDGSSNYLSTIPSSGTSSTQSTNSQFNNQYNNSSNYLPTIPSSGTSRGRSNNQYNNRNTLLLTILGVIIGVMSILLIISFSCCFYEFIEKRKLKINFLTKSYIYVNTNNGMELIQMKDAPKNIIDRTKALNLTNPIEDEPRIYEELDIYVNGNMIQRDFPKGEVVKDLT